MTPCINWTLLINTTADFSLDGQENKSCVSIPVNVHALRPVAEIHVLPVCQDRIRNGYVSLLPLALLEKIEKHILATRKWALLPDALL